MVIQSTDKDFKDILSSNNKIVVKYYADWCGTCKLFSPRYKRMSDEERFTGISFVEVNAEENPEARKLAGVSNLPFMAVFKDGNLLEAVATAKEEAIIEMLSKLNS